MTPSTNTNAGGLLEHLFRRHAARMVARLARLMGPSRIDLAEEVVQDSMLRALQTWPYQGVPPNPAGWLMRVAHNQAIDRLRRDRFNAERSEEVLASLTAAASVDTNHPLLDEHFRDDELRLILLCCHPALAHDSAVALSLKLACGFSVREIARAFLAEDAAIAQRLVRARRQIMEQRVSLELPAAAEIPGRLDAMLSVLYYLFNEGYSAHEGKELIRRDLCTEALRLARLIAGSSLETPAAHALAALTALQSARIPARLDSAGDLVLLDNQDRGRWDQHLIAIGFHHFNRSMSGNTLSRYHVEAAIAATHARAANGSVTEWPLILDLYDQLLALTASPVVALNRAVAVGQVRGPAEALAAIEPLAADPRLQNYYLLLAVRGHLLLQLGRNMEAASCFRSAAGCRCSEPERRFLARQLNACTGYPE